MKQFVLIALAATLVGHYGLYKNWQVEELKAIQTISDQRDKINEDQIVELMAGLREANSKLETERDQGYIAGMLDNMQKPDHYNEIWHSGYNRGQDVGMEILKVSQETEVIDPKYPKKE